MQSNVLALWRVSNSTIQAMKEEAKTDALHFWDDNTQPKPHLTVTHCTVNKINEGRIESWKGWAVLSCGDITHELLSRIIADQEQAELSLYSLRVQQQQPPTVPL